MTKTENLIGTVLLVGVLASALVVLAGGGVFLSHHGRAPVHYRVFRGEPSDLCTPAGVLRDVRAGSGRGLIQLGLMLLVAVQVVRVALAGLLFALNGDRLFTAITAFVLGLLMYGLLLAR